MPKDLLTEEERKKILTFMKLNPRIPFEDVASIFNVTYDEVLRIAVDNKMWG
jgi:hypothetical protein